MNATGTNKLENCNDNIKNVVSLITKMECYDT